MLKYSNLNINKMYFDTHDLVKVYRNNAICYYKVTTGSTPTQTPCFAVVDDISQYQDTEFEDVFQTSDGKWYKLNNLNEYEEYGVYGSGRAITYYDGKLTIDDGYEYIHSGGSWVNVGEVTGSTRVPSGYVELTYAQTVKQNVNPTSAFTVPIDLQESYNYIFEFTPLDWTQSYYGLLFGGIDNGSNYPSCGIFKLDNGWGSEYQRFDVAFWNYTLATNQSKPAARKYRVFDNVRAKFTLHLHNYDATQGADIIVENEGYPTSSATSTQIHTSGYAVTSGIYNIPMFSRIDGNSCNTAYFNFHCMKVETTGGTAIYEYVPCKRKSDNKVGLYDVVNDAFYAPQFLLNAGDEASTIIYPMYYDEMQDPPNNLTFSSMTEAEDYECPWVGMNATIDGDKYVFSGDSQSGYEWVYNPSRLPIGYTEVEYIQNPNNSLAYIDTGFKPNQDTRIVCAMQIVDSSRYGRFIGCGAYNAVNAIQFDYEEYYNGTLHVSWGHLKSWSTYSSCVGDYNLHTYDWDKNYFYRDKGETNQFSASTTYTNFQCTENLGIFAYITNGSVGSDTKEHMYGKLYSFKVYDDGTLIRDLVPCTRDSDSMVGCYDIVNDVFYYPPNSASYQFVAGPIV